MKQVAIALSQLANAVLGGQANETLAARAWHAAQGSRRWLVVKRALDAVFWGCLREEGHCIGAVMMEFDRHNEPSVYRK